MSFPSDFIIPGEFRYCKCGMKLINKETQVCAHCKNCQEEKPDCDKTHSQLQQQMVELATTRKEKGFQPIFWMKEKYNPIWLREATPIAEEKQMNASVIITYKINEETQTSIIPATITKTEKNIAIVSVMYEGFDLSHPVSRIVNRNFTSITLNINGKELPSQLRKFDAFDKSAVLLTLEPLPEPIIPDAIP